MKKISVLLMVITLFTGLFSLGSYANMAAPLPNDVGSTVTFEKNEDISVLSEKLDLRVEGDSALIKATYQMKNQRETEMTTKSMFLSPNMESTKVEILNSKKKVPYTSQSYLLNNVEEIEKKGWQYAVLSRKEGGDFTDRTVDTVFFELHFAPLEEYEVCVSYKYKLGGRPNLDFDAKNGKIHYYLTPAALWKDFQSIEINLYLDEEMPVLKESNLEFEKVEKGHYRYVSDNLPKEDLNILIDETAFQSFKSFFRSPYLLMNLMMFSPIILLVLLIVMGFTIIAIKYFKKKKKFKTT